MGQTGLLVFLFQASSHNFIISLLFHFFLRNFFRKNIDNGLKGSKWGSDGGRKKGATKGWRAETETLTSVCRLG